MYAFSFERPASLADATRLAARANVRPLAGGQSLIASLKLRLASPGQLVDLGGVAQLAGIAREGAGLKIGAMTRHADVAASADVKAVIPALADLAANIGDRQVRALGTLGGSLANNDPAADYPSAVLALNAKIVTNKREIAADDFFQGLFTTALEPGELIVRVVFPIPKRAAYEKFPHPASGYAMTGVFVAETAGGVRVAVTGAGPGVFRWKEAEAALGKKIAADSVASLRMKPDDLNEDIHATREYRANLVNVLTKRAAARIAGGK